MQRSLATGLGAMFLLSSLALLAAASTAYATHTRPKGATPKAGTRS